MRIVSWLSWILFVKVNDCGTSLAETFRRLIVVLLSSSRWLLQILIYHCLVQVVKHGRSGIWFSCTYCSWYRSIKVTREVCLCRLIIVIWDFICPRTHQLSLFGSARVSAILFLKIHQILIVLLVYYLYWLVNAFVLKKIEEFSRLLLRLRSVWRAYAQCILNYCILLLIFHLLWKLLKRLSGVSALPKHFIEEIHKGSFLRYTMLHQYFCGVVHISRKSCNFVIFILLRTVHGHFSANLSSHIPLDNFYALKEYIFYLCLLWVPMRLWSVSAIVVFLEAVQLSVSVSDLLVLLLVIYLAILYHLSLHLLFS